MQLSQALKQLEKQIKNDVQQAVIKTLEAEVFELVRDIMSHHIQTDVYDVYSPKIYKRRYTNQGLLDERNIVYDIERGKELVVWNIAKMNSRNNRNASFSLEKRKENLLQTIIIDGWSTATKDSPVWSQPRPFISNANRSLSRGGAHFSDLDDAFASGLGRFGINKINT